MTTQPTNTGQGKKLSGTRFPVGVLSAALTVTGIVLAWLGWSAFQFYCYTQGNLLNTTRALEENRAELSVVLAIGGLFLAMFTWIAVLRSLNRWRLALIELAERSQAEEALTLSERRFRALVQNATDIIMILDQNAGLRYLSPGVERVWGYETKALLGKSGFDLVHFDDLARAEALLIQAGDSPETNIVSELRLCRADGSWRSCEVILRNMVDEPGVEGVVITYHDITERKAFENQLAHQAFHDSLSGLPNRALFMDRLGRALARAQRHDYMVAVLFLDLDNFKVINDSLGHQAGDELLKNVTQRLISHARPEDTVARLGGDEFTLLLENLTDIAEATTVAGRITEALQSPIILQGYEMFVTASIGIAVSVGGYGDADALLRDADIAMYQAKNAGKAHHVVFDRSMNHHAMERLELEAELRQAIDNGELRVHYQPIMTLDTGKVSEVEALVRWEHPRRGLVPPSKFIPLAEETGLIAALGQWVLREACHQAAAWHAQYPDQEPLIISVNLSAKQLQHADLVGQVAEVLRESGLPPQCLKLEITESVMMANVDATIAKLYQLKELGLSLAVDDFGTGYSSMAYLSRFPIDTLKIDRSFVNRMGRQSEDDAIVRAIVNLAKTLNLRITSEGIETSEQLAELQALGCDHGQGYLFARPLTTAAVSAFLSASNLAHEAPVPPEQPASKAA